MARTPVTTTRFTPRDVSMIYAVRIRASRLGYQIDSDADALRWALAVACEGPKSAWTKGAARLARTPESIQKPTEPDD